MFCFVLRPIRPIRRRKSNTVFHSVLCVGLKIKCFAIISFLLIPFICLISTLKMIVFQRYWQCFEGFKVVTASEKWNKNGYTVKLFYYILIHYINNFRWSLNEILPAQKETLIYQFYSEMGILDFNTKTLFFHVDNCYNLNIWWIIFYKSVVDLTSQTGMVCTLKSFTMTWQIAWPICWSSAPITSSSNRSQWNPP